MSEAVQPTRLGWVGVALNLMWTLVLAGLGLFNEGSLHSQRRRIALLFVCIIPAPAALAVPGLRSRPGFLLAAAIISVPLSLLSLAGRTLPLLLPAVCYLITYHRASPETRDAV